jgi:hypothetical protein
MKIRVECRATVMVDVSVTAKQLRQLDAGEIKLDDIVDESIPYQALSNDGTFEFTEWDRIQPKQRQRHRG